ncbi:MAG: D-alanine--D-alanine ligase [Candidatus Doudnabacteria bacterium]|nr:D-alanine--D-alanine ligase [Candidatus Doudnabacteria bacterium]
MPKQKKLKVALIFGGTSQEREVSLSTGATMAQNLDPRKYDVIPIEISKQGKWLTSSGTIRQISRSVIARSGATKQSQKEIASLITRKDERGKPDVALLALHGPGGEDGTIQGMLELLKIPYTCSSVLASALAMDKIRTKVFVTRLGIKVAHAVLVYKHDYASEKKHYFKQIRGKVVVKPNRMGSSLGTFIVSGKAAVDRAIKKAFRHDSEVLVEKFIEGTELTVPVLGNTRPQALPVIEIVPLISNFFDYKAKYAVGGTDEIVPARISDKARREVQTLALQIHLAMGCRGLTRSDFIMNKKGELYFLEINTIPGLTPTSLVPKSAAAAGISYPQLLDILIKLALQKD